MCLTHLSFIIQRPAEKQYAKLVRLFIPQTNSQNSVFEPPAICTVRNVSQAPETAILLGQDQDNDHLDLLSHSILSSFDLNFSSVFAGYYFGRMGGHHVLRYGCPLLLQFYIFYIAYYSKYTLTESI